MGMLANGTWQDQERPVIDGNYQRPISPLRLDLGNNVLRAMNNEPNRFWLIASHSCPWSHRATITVKLKGFRDKISIHFAHGKRVQGYPLDDGEEWPVPGTDRTIRHLHELYTLSDPAFSGRATVPVLWDSKERIILSNESANIVSALDQLDCDTCPPFHLRPKELEQEIERANAWIYDALNNAVYRAGFAKSQNAYDEAVRTVFLTLDSLENHLTDRRYYFGNKITETDVRLFPTLVRFDSIYHVLFRCSRRRLTDYPNLWAYARDLFSRASIAETVDFDLMRTASYLSDSRDPFPIVAIAPDANWHAPQDRADLDGVNATA